jgi:ComF family protein
MQREIVSWWKCVESLLFPELCPGCGNHLYEEEEIICVGCRMSLPYTHDQYQQIPAVEKVFQGRVPIEAASAYLFFHKHSAVQRLLHQLKYQGHRELGTLLGKMHAHQFLEKPAFQNIDCCIPIPLHPQKLKARGYNQAEVIATGIAEVTETTLLNKAMRRQSFTETQTHKSRYNRYENMQGVFALNEPDEIYGKHVLLVDDVVTTGSTIESCASILLSHGARAVSVACVAYAVR